MTLLQLKYFLEAAKAGSFTLAANNLFVAPSSLSYAIHELEHELGVPLFVRSAGKKKIELTEYGKKYLPYSEQIFKLLDAGETELKTLKDPLSGVVRLGFYYCVSDDEVPMIVRSFYRDNPNCDIFLDVDVYNGEEMIDNQIVLGKYDLVISTSEMIKDCEHCKIGSQKLKIMLADTHHLASRGKLRLEDLDGEPIVSMNPNSNLDRWIREMFRFSGINPDISYVSDWTTQACYVALNYGIAITPSMPTCRNYVVAVDIDHPMVWRDLNLFWPTNRQLSKSIEFVRDYIVEYSKRSPIISE